MDVESTVDARKIFGDDKNDHRILNAALALNETEGKRKVILVTKDINLRLKAKSLDLQAEDYQTGKIKNADPLDTGKTELEGVSSAEIDTLFKDGELNRKMIFKKTKPAANSFYILKSEKNSVLAYHDDEEKKIIQVEN